MSIRYVKTRAKTPQGCRISVANSTILTSSGVSSLDELFGGGIPLGSVVMLNQDRSSGYALLLVKYFIAQGLAFDHTALLCSLDIDTHALVTDLMGIVTGKASTTVTEEDNEEYVPSPTGTFVGRSPGQLRANRSTPQGEDMRIAWRYRSLGQFSSSLNIDSNKTSTTYCHTFDLTRRIAPEILNKASIMLIDASNISDGSNNNLKRILDSVCEILSDPAYDSSKVGGSQKVLRVAIHSLCSPMWEGTTSDVYLNYPGLLQVYSRLENGNQGQKLRMYDDDSSVLLRTRL